MQGVKFCLTLPGVVDVLAQIAIVVGETAVGRLLKLDVTVAETRILREFVAHLPERFQADYRNALEVRGRLFELDVPKLGLSALPPKSVPEMFEANVEVLEALQVR